ncbi:MAG: GTPase domain-containing protein [Gemmataceae bacterium]|nr:GTPase domain-containing protein [Gemmataceae bacterium]
MSRLERTRAECSQLAERINAFLAEHGRPTVSVIRADKLRIAFMGQYNAGKSTLVNALLGVDKAAMGDAPTTREVHTYEYRDFHILDLPGLGARAAEAEKAERGLSEAHAILYVVSSQTGLDYDTFWDDLRRLNQGYHWLLVINDKQSHFDERAERRYREEVLKKFFERASQYLSEETRLQDRVFWVNADSARRARVACPPKRRLEEASGILSLESCLISFLAQNDVFLRAVPRLADLRQALEVAIEEWQKELKSKESQTIYSALQICDRAIDRMDAIAQGIAEDHFSGLCEQLASYLITCATEGRSSEEAEEEANRMAEDCWRDARGTFERRWQVEWQLLRGRLGIEVDQAQNPLEGPGVNLTGLPVLATANRARAGEWIDLSGVLRVVLPSQPRVSSKGGFPAWLLAIPLLRNVGKRLLPLVGIGLVVFDFILQWWRRSEEKERLEAKAREVQSQARAIADRLRGQFLSLAAQTVRQDLAPTYEMLNNELRARSRSAAAVENRIGEAQNLRNRLQQMIAELNAGRLG